MHSDIAKVLLTEEEILVGIDRVADEVNAAFGGREFTAVSVLKGSCIFVADLIRRIPSPLGLAFVYAESYGADVVPGKPRLHLLPRIEEVLGADVLLIDDILDTGRTLSFVERELLTLGARSVRTCVFLDKPARRAVSFEADHHAFRIDDHFAVGYGLDFAGRYRNLPYVGALSPEASAAARQG